MACQMGGPYFFVSLFVVLKCFFEAFEKTRGYVIDWGLLDSSGFSDSFAANRGGLVMVDATKCLLLVFGVIVLFSATPNADAGIKRYLYVNNSRSSNITVTVEKSDHSTSSYTVYAHSKRNIEVGDSGDGTTWLYAYDGSGGEIKRESASGQYSDFTWYVD
jgi:hypothetical protein